MAALDARPTSRLEPPELQSLPVEILIKVYGYLDIKHALRLARTSKLLCDIYESNSIYILEPILMREFSPLDGLLRLTDVARDYFEVPHAVWFKRRICFAGRLIADDDTSAAIPEIQIKQEHMSEVMKVVKAVSRWESAFPRLRFAELVEERRTLRPHEKERLRRALYSLWRYANSYHHHHHYDSGVSHSWLTSHDQAEVRADSLRSLSTMELYELQDLWKTVRAAVTTQLCPSVSVLRRIEGNSISESYLELRGWGDGLENDVVVANVLRLPPDKLLDLLEFVAVNPATSKSTLAAMIRACHPTVDRAYETLTHALTRIIGERLHIFPEELNGSVTKFITERNFPIPFGGILDDEFAMEELRSQLSSDGGEGLTEGFEEDVDFPDESTDGEP